MRSLHIWAAVVLSALFLFCVLLSGQEKRLTIFGPQMHYDVSVVDKPAGQYVGLLDILEPLGKIESRVDGAKWHLRFSPPGAAPISADFEANKRTGKLRNAPLDLGANFILQSDRGYVPLSSLPTLLPRLLDKIVDLHLAGRRLFLSGTGIKYSLEVRHNPTRLVATFPSSVAPAITSNGNHVRLTFTREPVISSGADNVAYNDPPITSLSFIESNGSAILDVAGTGPLEALISDGGKVVTVSAQPQAAAQQPPPAQPAAKPETPLPPPNVPATASVPTVRPAGARRTNLVVIDAAHGGDERGAQLTESLNEKDVTLALARRIQHELENRGFSVLMLRPGDSTLTSDQRAAAANAARAGYYIGLHAATLGTGVRVYTALLPPAPAAMRRTFLPWDSAQAPFLDQSIAAAAAVANELSNNKIPVRSLSAPLRPLKNIAGCAIAIEIAPSGDNVESINDAKYQQNVAAAVASGIASLRGKLEAQ